MPFAEILQDIVKKSIRSTVCIDDQVIEPYKGGKGDTELSRQLYTAFSKGSNTVTMVKYRKKTTKKEWISLFNQKDLAVIDWDLKNNNESIPLELIEYSLISHIPYICIYTNEKNPGAIRNIIWRYFSGNTQKEVEAECDQFEKCGLACEEEELNDLLIRHFEQGINLFDELKRYFKKKTLVRDNPPFNKLDIEAWGRIYLGAINAKLPERKTIQKANLLQYGENVVKIGGTNVFVFAKKGSADTDSVAAEEILATMAQKIVEDPNSKVTPLMIYMSNEITEAMQEKASFLENVSDYAVAKFLISQKPTAKENEIQPTKEQELFAMKKALRELYKRLVYQSIGLLEQDIPDELFDKLDEDIGPIIDNAGLEAAKLNYVLNTNTCLTEREHNIEFGDVFTKDGEFYLCVTGKCVCLRPAKTDYTYSFMKGHRASKLNDAVKYAEKNFFSFVLDAELEPIGVNWDDEKVVMARIVNAKVVKGSRVRARVAGSKSQIEMTYVCNLFEEYAQRMANHIFSVENKVGVTYATFIS